MQSPLEALSDREREILSAMAQGRSNQAICERLHLSERTVESHVGSIFGKLGFPRMELAGAGVGSALPAALRQLPVAHGLGAPYLGCFSRSITLAVTSRLGSTARKTLLDWPSMSKINA